MNRCVEKASRQHHFPLVVGKHFAFDAIPALETFLVTNASVRMALSGLERAHTGQPMLSTKMVEGER